jgi:hypothetical protein
MIQTYVLTNDNHIWLMRSFLHLWNKYAECEHYCTWAFIFYGTKFPDPFYPCKCRAVGQFPASRWSDSLIASIDIIQDDYFILMLEDYWLYDYVDFDKINQLQDLMTDDILRIDISGNRASYKAAREIAPGIVETPPGTPYQMSFQAAIWHKENLRKVLREGESPWEAEVNGSGRVGDLRVLGTKPAMMRYQPVWRSQQQRWQLDRLKTIDIDFMMGKGWLDGPS